MNAKGHVVDRALVQRALPSWSGGLLSLAAVVWVGAAWAVTVPTWPLNDTGIDWCANGNTNRLACPVAGYPDQDAENGRDVTHDNDTDGHAGFAFTKLDANGKALPASATAWSCVRDNVTGLIWEVKTDDGGLHDKDWNYTWHNPDPATNGGSAGISFGHNNCWNPARCDTHKFTADVNVAGLCGASDWRLPTRDELRSIVDYSRYGPAIDTAWFPDIGQYWGYWSSSPYAFSADFAWYVPFYYGDGGYYPKAGAYHVRLVRGGQALSLDDHGDTRDTATKIGVDSRTAGRINYPGDNDFFRLQVGTAGTLTLYTTGSTDTYGYLLNAQGGELARNDDATVTNKNFRIKRSVAPGTYFVRARHALSSGTGAYTLAAEFTAANGKAQRAVLLLHGMNSAPDTWNKLVTERWSGKCETIYAGVVTPITAPPQDSLGAACYRMKFGRYDRTGFTGLENLRCPTTEKEGCKGDFTAINASVGDDLGVEVFAAVRAILWRLGSDAQVVLLGHSRGGLAARAFLQLPATSAERNAIVGLVTTGTPHRGSPLGRIYPYLKAYCLDASRKRIGSGNKAGKPEEVWQACDADWKAADWLLDSLDVRRPTIAFLAPTSVQIAALNSASSLANLPTNLSLVQLRYAGQYIGHLAKLYSAWDHPGSGDVNDNFSIRSRDYALCGKVIPGFCCATTENEPKFDGDGIVPKASQSIPGFEQQTLAGTAGTFHVAVKKALSAGETSRVQDIAKALSRVDAWK